MDTPLLITIVLLLLVILAGGRRTTEPPAAITVIPTPTPATQGAGCADALVVGLLILVALLLLAGRTG